MGVAQPDAMSAKTPNQLAKVNHLASRPAKLLAFSNVGFIN